MFRTRKTDALVVGAGPVGLHAALQLADAGLAADVIDAEWREAARSYALALHPESLALLDDAGVTRPLLAQGRRINTMAFYQGAHRRAELDLSPDDSSDPGLLVIPQSTLEQQLAAALAKRHVQVWWNHRLVDLVPGADAAPTRAMVERRVKDSVGYATAGSEWVIDRTFRWQAGFVLGADGSRSAVRRLCEIDFPAVAPPQVFAVFEFVSDFNAHGEVRVVLDDAGTSVLWPLPDGRCRWSFQVDQPDDPPADRLKSRLAVMVGEQPLAHLDHDHLHRLIDQRAPWFDGTVGEIAWSLLVQFDHRLADRFGIGHVHLAGDAAHLTGPVGVRSMNAGIHDGRTLAQHIAHVAHGGDRAPLEAASRARREAWRATLATPADAGFAPDADPWVRDHADRILPCLPGTGEHLHTLAARLGLATPCPA